MKSILEKNKKAREELAQTATAMEMNEHSFRVVVKCKKMQNIAQGQEQSQGGL